MSNYIINGLNIGFAKKMTGVQRVCRELTYRLDKLVKDTEINIWYIYDVDELNLIIVPDQLKNIKLIPVKKDNGPFWKDRIVRMKLKELNALLICLSFETIFAKNQIILLHDLRAVTTSFDIPKIRLKYKLKMMLVKHTCKMILTVSEFQKEAIQQYFHINQKDKIHVIYNGYEHVMDIKPDYSIFKRYPQIREKEFFYSLGSLAPHKNFQWVIEVAKRNKDRMFVIAGGKDLLTWKDNIENNNMHNVIFVGYVSDEENRALMEKCLAFIHPAKYEGFGIPPLEALAYGAKILISNATCLPEIYEDCAVYFDPDDYDVNFDDMLNEPVAKYNKVLEKCSWNKSAKKLFELLEKS